MNGHIGAIAKVTVLRDSGSGQSTGTAISGYEKAVANSRGAEMAWTLTPSPAVDMPSGGLVCPCVTSVTITEGINVPPEYRVEISMSRLGGDGFSAARPGEGFGANLITDSPLLETGNILAVQILYPAFNVATRVYKGIMQVPEVDIGEDGFVTATIVASGFSVLAVQASVGASTLRGTLLEIIEQVAVLAGFTAPAVDKSLLDPETLSKLNAKGEIVVSASQPVSEVMRRMASLAGCSISYRQAIDHEQILLVPSRQVVNVQAKTAFRFFGQPAADELVGYGFKTTSKFYWTPGSGTRRTFADISADTKQPVESPVAPPPVPSTASGVRADVKPRSKGEKVAVAPRSTANSADPLQAAYEAAATDIAAPGAVGVEASWSTPGSVFEVFDRVEARGIGPVFSVEGGYLIQSVEQSFDGSNWTTNLTVFGTGVRGHKPATVHASPATAVANPSGTVVLKPENP